MVKHTHTIRQQFADKLFECVWPFCGIGAERVNKWNNLRSNVLKITSVQNDNFWKCRWYCVRKSILRNFAKFTGKHLFYRIPPGDCFYISWKGHALFMRYSRFYILIHFNNFAHSIMTSQSCDVMMGVGVEAGKHFWIYLLSHNTYINL